MGSELAEEEREEKNMNTLSITVDIEDHRWKITNTE